MCANDGDIAYTVPPTRGRERNDTVVMGAVQRRLESLYPYMKGHWQRIAFEGAGICEELELSRDDLELFRTCAYLMDIGMIDDSIHALVAKCTDKGVDYMQNAEIRRAVERHPILGSIKLEELGFPKPVVLAVRHHHEWYNGWGYPDGISGVKIPAISRILSVTDAFVSLTSDRPFRYSCPAEEALEEIIGYSGVQFDPWVVPALEKVVTQDSHATESLIDRGMDLDEEEFEA